MTSTHSIMVPGIKSYLFFLLLLAFPAVSYADRYVDYRFSPEWFVSTTCLPDDSFKTMVGPNGQLLYDFRGSKGGFFPYSSNQGFHTVIFFQADEDLKISGTKLLSPKIPVVLVKSSMPGISVLQQTFSSAGAIQSHQAPVHPLVSDREDIILLSIENQSNSERTLHPKVIVNSDHKVVVEGRVVTIDSTRHFYLSLSPERVRRNLIDYKTVIDLEPVLVPARSSVNIAGIFDNGLESTLANELLENCDETMSALPRIYQRVQEWWEDESGIPYDCIHVPDKEIQNLLEASVRGIWQAREYHGGKISFQVGPTHYRGLWIVDGAFLLEAAALMGRGMDARAGIETTLSYQKESGEFAKLTPTFWKENGIVLWTCVRHAMLTQDKEWLTEKWPALSKTIDFIHSLRESTYGNEFPEDDGLVPPGFIDGGLRGGPDQPEYTNVVWCLSGIKAMIEAAKWIGKSEDAGRWQAEYDDFYEKFIEAADRDMATDEFGNRYLNTLMRPEQRSLPQKGQWAFCQSVYPGQIFEVGNPIVKGTMDMLEATLQDGMVMGTGWITEGAWNYFASFYGHAWLWNGAPAKAADALYAFANHASPLYNWREEHNPKDITQRYVGDMPHNWASAEFIRLASHLLQLDRGTELHLLEGLPEEWVRKGMSTSLNGMATPFGPLNLSLKVDRFGRSATLKVSAMKGNCARLIVHLGNWAKTPDGTQVIILDPGQENEVKIKLNPIISQP